MYEDEINLNLYNHMFGAARPVLALVTQFVFIAVSLTNKLALKFR